MRRAAPAPLRSAARAGRFDVAVLPLVLATLLLLPASLPGHVNGNRGGRAESVLEPATSATARAAVTGPAARPSLNLTPPVRTLDLANNSSEPGNWIPLAATDPTAAAYDASTGVTVVLGGSSGTATLFRNGTATVTVRVGPEPDAVAINASSAIAYVADGGSAELIGLALSNGSVVARVPVGSLPDAVVVDAAAGTVWTANAGSSNLSVVRTATETVIATVALPGNPSGLALAAANGTLWATIPSLAAVVAVNATTDAVGPEIPVGSGAEAVAVDPSTGVAFVANTASRNLTVVRPTGISTWATATIPLAGNPVGVAYDPSSGNLTVLASPPGRLLLLNASSGVVVGTDPAPPGATALIPTGTGGVLLVIVPGSDQVLVGRPLAGHEIASFGTGPFSWGADWMTFDPANGRLYATIWDENEIEVLDPSNGSYLATLPVGPFVVGTTWDPQHDLLVVPDGNSGTLSLINTTTDRALPNVSNPSATWLYDALYDPGTGLLYVSDNILDSVYVYEWNGSSYAPYRTIAMQSILAGELATGYMTLDPSNQRLFVGEESTGKVTVINASSLQIVTNISTGGSPGVPAFDPSNGLVYVPDASPTSHNISVIDPTTDSVVARLDAGCQPLHAQYDPGSADVYVLCQSRDLDRIDSATGAIALAIDLGSCQQLSMTAGPGFAIDDATNRVFIADEDAYVPCTYGLNMTELALPSYSVGQALALGSLPAGVAATGPSGTTVVADRGAGRIDLVAPSGALLLRSRPVGLEPTYVAFDGRSNDVVISDSLLGNLTVLNASTLATVQSIALPTPAGVLSSDPADGAVLAALPVAGLVDRIVPGPNPVRASVPVGPDPTALADDSALATTLVYCSGDRSLWGVPDAGGAALRLATGLPNASGLGVDGATGEVVLSDASGGSLTVLNGTTFALLRTLGVPSNGSTPSRPGALGFDSADGALLVLDSAGNALGFVSPWRAPLTNETAVGGAPTAFAVEPDGTIVVADAASGTLTVASPLPVPTVDGIAVSPAPLLGSAGDRLSVHAQTSYGNATGIPGLEFRWNLAPASIGALNTSRGPADVGLVVGNTGFANGTLCATVSEGSLSVRGCVGLTVVPGPRYAATVTLAPGVLVIGTGQSVNFSAGVRTVDGAATIGPTLTWSVAPSALGSLTTGISGAAQFVAGAFPSQGTVCANASGGGGEAQACAAVTVGAIPRVTSVDPANRSMNVPLVSRVTVEFSTPMNATATESAFGVAPADPSGSVTVNGTSLVWTPSGNLKANVTYTITIGPGATSTVGVRLGHALTATFQTVPDLTSPKTASGPSWTVPLLALGAVAAIGVVAAVGWRRRRAKPSAPRGT